MNISYILINHLLTVLSPLDICLSCIFSMPLIFYITITPPHNTYSFFLLLCFLLYLADSVHYDILRSILISFRVHCLSWEATILPRVRLLLRHPILKLSYVAF